MSKSPSSKVLHNETLAKKITTAKGDERFYESIMYMNKRRNRSKLLAETVSVHITKLNDLP